MSQEPHAHDRLNAELIELMRQQTGTEQKDIEIMGKRFIVFPEVFYSPLLQHILEVMAHSPLKIVAEELARRGRLPWIS